MSGYAKLFSSILHSTIWLEPDHIRLVWITMLAMADRHGLVETSVPGLAVAARVDLAQCEEALAKLKAPDPHSRTKEFEGRRIEDATGGFLVLTYELHRARASAASKRESRSASQAKWRNRKKLGLVGTEKREETDSVYSDQKSIDIVGVSGSGSGSDQDPDPERATETDVVGTPGERASMYLTDPMAARLSLQPPEQDDAVVELCAAWERTWGVAVTIRGGMNDPRLRVILERLADGFSIAQLVDAISGSKLDDHILSNRRFQSLKTVLRDAETVDAHAAALKPAPSPAAKPFTFPEGVKFYPLSDAERLPLNPEHSG